MLDTPDSGMAKDRIDTKRSSPHPLFDAEWYQQSNPDIPPHLATFGHYLSEGWRKLKSPHPLFSVEYYFQQRPDVRNAGVEPLGHFVTQGWKERSNPHPLFDVEFYLSQGKDFDGVDPLTHYVTLGWKQGRKPNASANQCGRSHQLDEVVTGSFSISHDRVGNRPEQRSVGAQNFSPTLEDSAKITAAVLDESGLFDPLWYLANYTDISHAGLDPREHFIHFGSAELRSPGPGFESTWYARQYPDVRESGLEPLVHYVKIGRAEGRKPVGPPVYQRWIERFDELASDDIEAIRFHISAIKLPTVHVILRFDGQNETHLEAAIGRLEGQIYRSWRAVICIESDCSVDAVRIARLAASRDERLIVLHVPVDDEKIVHSQCVESLLLAEGSVLLREHALYMFALAALRGACLVYSDEDRLDEKGERFAPTFKPEYSAEFFRNQNYFGRCVFARGPNFALKSMALDFVRGRKGLDALLDEVVPGTNSDDIIHISHVLYHDLVEQLQRDTRRASANLSEDASPRVSIIIPTRDGLDLLKPCIESILRDTAYPRDKFEIIVVDNGSREEKTIKFLVASVEAGAIRVVNDPEKFNFSKLNNLAAANSQGDIFVFLNNDTTVNDSGWLRRLVDYAVCADVGAVGSKLLYPDGTVQHGGVVLGIQGVAAHAHVGLSATDGGFQGLANTTREVSAVTGACLAMRRDLFEKLGGFDTAFAVAFNDIDLCLRAIKAGYRNIYIQEALVIHHESKTRGYDDTPDKIALFRREACLARKRYGRLFNDDAYYNPNLSLERVYELAFPPRRAKPWKDYTCGRRKLRILMLSVTHAVGHGVPLVIDQQSTYLAQAGYEVFVGGPRSDNEFLYEGCRRIEITDPKGAAEFAVENNIDCIVAHTPPFFSVSRWVGEWPKVICYDYGEPPPEFFPSEVEARRAVAAEKRFVFATADRLFAISAAVQSEAEEENMGIIPLGNAHLAVWQNDLMAQRILKRNAMGWADKFVILNVCRFHQAERHYKGVDFYAEIMHRLVAEFPDLARRVVFALCGKGNREDQDYMRALGVEVFASVSDAELIDFYGAADFYLSLSQWEGYNLGVGQALAMGLPVIASDIPAHRAFPILCSNDPSLIVEQLACAARDAIANEFSSERDAVVTKWEPSLVRFVEAIEELCRSHKS